MLRVLITGKSSFIGCAAADRLSQFPEDFSVEQVSLREKSLQDMSFRGFDAVIHAAGIAHVNPDPSLEGEYMRVNRGLAVETARKARADGVRHFIFLSSIIVYGDAAPAGRERIIGPDTPPAPAGAYGQSKLEAEEGIRALACEDFTVSVLRLPMVYGRGCKGNYNALSALARRLPLFPALRNHRSVLYIGNLAECIRIILNSRLGGLFFPQDEEMTSTRELAERIARAHGRKIHFLGCLDPLVKLAGRRGIVRRAFGDMAYAPEMSLLPGDYRIYTPDDAVRSTEIH